MATRDIIVHIWLEDQTEPVPCGRLTYTYDGRNSFSEFSYGRRYLERGNAIPIDPIRLPLDNRNYTTEEGFDLPGAIRDASPDGWGRHVLSRLKGTQELAEIDYLCLADPEDRFGALGFGVSPKQLGGFDEGFDKVRNENHGAKISSDDDFLGMLDHIEDLIKYEKTDENKVLAQYFFRGTSLGGARPKATVRIGNEYWLAKFPRADDPSPITRYEYVMMELGREMGLDVPETKLIKVANRYIYLIKRFDRLPISEKGIRKTHAISALTAIGANERDYGIWGYQDLDRFLQQYGEDYMKDRKELFGRIALNIATSNTDDHLRNHSFLYQGGKFSLSPLYDVCPIVQDQTSVKNLYLNIGTNGREATFENLKSYADKMGLSSSINSETLNFLNDALTNKFPSLMEKAELNTLERRALESQIRKPV